MHLVSVAYSWEAVKFEIISLIYGEIVIMLNFIGLSIDTINNYLIWDKQHHIGTFRGKTYHILVVYFINYR